MKAFCEQVSDDLPLAELRLVEAALIVTTVATSPRGWFFRIFMATPTAFITTGGQLFGSCSPSTEPTLTSRKSGR